MLGHIGIAQDLLHLTELVSNQCPRKIRVTLLLLAILLQYLPGQTKN